MKRILLATALAAMTFTTSASTNVGVSVSIGQPGFYGQIDIGNFPQPQLLYPTPIVIQQGPVAVVPQPIYLRVPPGHAKNWRKYCWRYHACGQPVYFVQDNWYNNVYAPRYREYEHERGNGRGDRDDQGDHGDRGDHGKGHDKHDHGKGH